MNYIGILTNPEPDIEAEARFNARCEEALAAEAAGTLTEEQAKWIDMMYHSEIHPTSPQN